MRNLTWITLIGCCAVSLIYRLHPIFLGGDSLKTRFMTEDGYLMLTVARNLAIGRGLSVTDGEILTNGIQPLATLLFTVPYLVTGGDKLSSLAGIVAISVVVAIVAALAVRRFAERALAVPEPDPIWFWIVAALWFCGPLLLGHSMNALETGLYSLLVLGTLLLFDRLTRLERPWTFGERVLLGVACGLAFLGRNDAAFLIFAICITQFASVALRPGRGLGAAIAEVVPVGLVSILCALPWLAYNQIYFGSIIPISGTAQSLTAAFGQNSALVPAKLFEHMLPFLPVPGSIEDHPVFRAGAMVLVLAVLGAYAVQLRASQLQSGRLVAAYLIFALCLAAYYGLFFGAEHFLSRYFAPLAPVLMVAALSVGLGLLRLIGEQLARPLGQIGASAALLLATGLFLRQLLLGAGPHGHFQVVDWVEDHVPDTVYIGAIQTGTLGYWHDRTINLDGKVNPEALRARIDRGHVLDYVIDGPIEYLADWQVITTWRQMEHDRFGNVFEVVVDDAAANLGVLRRVAPR